MLWIKTLEIESYSLQFFFLILIWVIVISSLCQIFEAQLEREENEYNVTACCSSAGLSSSCMSLCSYDASMTKLKSLAGVCGPEFSKLVRCGAGGRNHSPCCSRRGVPAACLPLCSGVVIQSLAATATTCVPYIGNIVQCFEEGEVCYGVSQSSRQCPFVFYLAKFGLYRHRTTSGTNIGAARCQRNRFWSLPCLGAANRRRQRYRLRHTFQKSW